MLLSGMGNAITVLGLQTIAEVRTVQPTDAVSRRYNAFMFWTHWIRQHRIFEKKLVFQPQEADMPFDRFLQIQDVSW